MLAQEGRSLTGSTGCEYLLTATWACVAWYSLLAGSQWKRNGAKRPALNSALNVSLLSACEHQYRSSFTLPASLSGTFLQTLPGLVTLLKGHYLLQERCRKPMPRVCSSPFLIFSVAD